jgi:large subunit ribosomal protein L17
MLANLAASLVKNGRVKTTDAKAKEVRPFIERMVTFAKRGDLHARRIVLSRLRDAEAVKKLFEEYGPKFTDRLGGYTRILKLGFRPGDNSPVSLIEFVGNEDMKFSSHKAKTSVKSKQDKRSALAPTSEASNHPTEK